MKYLSHYTEEATTKALTANRAFFAFSNEQLEEARTEGVEYVSIGSGLICPKENVKDLIASLDTVHAEGIKADIAENGIKAIIHRELGNYETQLTGDLSDALSSLSGYGVTVEQVEAEYSEFYQVCVDNDYF